MRLNIVDNYNFDQKLEMLRLIETKDKTFKELEPDKYGIMLNKGNPIIFAEWRKNHLYVTDDNPLHWEKDSKITPFQILIEIGHKGSFHRAYSDLVFRFGDKSMPYIRVGPDYFKEVDVVGIDGVQRREVKKWLKAEIKEDITKDAFMHMRKYDGFIMRPNNLKFRQEVDGFYNIYQPFAHIPEKCKNIKKDCPWSYKMLNHVFGDQYELGIIYMQVLYLHPMQTLPILGLVSRENQTGKSTFANWIGMIFGGNASIIDINSFGSDFTEAFAERNIVVIEETKSKDEKIMNKLKALSTQKSLLVNKKNVSMYQTDFFCKFIINSNHENNFLRIDKEDIRYWVRKMPKLGKDNANHNIEADLLNEIPKFLGYLQQMKPVDFSRSRMVFTEEEIRTEQLEKVKTGSKTALYWDIKQRAEDFLADHPDFESLEFSVTDMKDYWYKNNSRYDSKYIKKTLEDEMDLDRSSTRGRYRSITNTGSMTKDKTGFFYTLERNHFDDWDLLDGYTGEISGDAPF